MSNDDDVLASLDFDPAPPACACEGHARALAGCDPARPAEYRAEVVRCDGPGRHGTNGWQPILVCRGHAGWLRTMTNHTMKCPVCRIDTTIGSLMRAAGPIESNPINPLH